MKRKDSLVSAYTEMERREMDCCLANLLACVKRGEIVIEDDLDDFDRPPKRARSSGSGRRSNRPARPGPRQ